MDFKTAPKNAVAGSIKYDDTGRIIEYQTIDGKTIKLSYESVKVPDSNLPSYAPVDGKTNINSQSFTRATWEPGIWARSATKSRRMTSGRSLPARMRAAA